MSKMELYQQVFIDGLGLEDDVVFDELALGATQAWDSIGHMTLIAELEDAFDVQIDADDMTAFDSYASGLVLLERLGVSFA